MRQFFRPPTRTTQETVVESRSDCGVENGLGGVKRSSAIKRSGWCQRSDTFQTVLRRLSAMTIKGSGLQGFMVSGFRDLGVLGWNHLSAASSLPPLLPLPHTQTVLRRLTNISLTPFPPLSLPSSSLPTVLRHTVWEV